MEAFETCSSVVWNWTCTILAAATVGACGSLALLLGAGNAFAAISTPENPTQLVGSDTLNAVIEVAQWRQNTNTLNEGLSGNAGGLFAASNRICQEADATRQIGCLVANTPCTLGFAGREAASTNPYDDLQEPVRLNGLAPNNPNLLAAPGFYPFKRDLFINAIGGFENLTFDCLDRGGSLNFCQDQVDLANEFWNMTTIARNACIGAGYIPLPTARCDGANHAGAASCGAPQVQALADCQPL